MDFYDFCTVVSRKKRFTYKWQKFPPHVNNVLTLTSENETSHFIPFYGSQHLYRLTILWAIKHLKSLSPKRPYAKNLQLLFIVVILVNKDKFINSFTVVFTKDRLRNLERKPATSPKIRCHNTLQNCTFNCISVQIYTNSCLLQIRRNRVDKNSQSNLIIIIIRTFVTR